jgi:cyclic pyranopterin phosphate synthase
MSEDMVFLPRQQILSLEEMVQIAGAFVSLGVAKIRLTGGEPLIRKGIVGLSRSLSRLAGLRELVMTTNAVLLDNLALPLAQAGISRMNISLDSLQPDRFKRLTRFGDLQQVLNGIEAARQAGFERIKLNAVILRGENDDEVVDLARFALDRGMDISFIEEMPLGQIESHARNDSQYQSQSIREQLGEHFQLLPSLVSTGGPSRYMSVTGYANRIGFISPISDNFCAACNRVRLTAEGQLLLCLGNEHSLNLKEVVRRYPGDTLALQEKIVEAIARKPERHYFDPADTQILRFMSATGG